MISVTLICVLYTVHLVNATPRRAQFCGNKPWPFPVRSPELSLAWKRSHQQMAAHPSAHGPVSLDVRGIIKG